MYVTPVRSALYSGHIIKYYLCNNEEEVYPVDNRDDEIQSILQRAREQAMQLQTAPEEPGSDRRSFGDHRRTDAGIDCGAA